MGATLTAPNTFLSHVSAAGARELWMGVRHFETVTRPGNGGPRRHGGLLVLRSSTLEGETETYRGVPMTTVPRTVLDLAATRTINERTLARLVRDALRLGLTSTAVATDYLVTHRGRRGTARLAAALTRYSGLPVHRARSGAEVRAMEVLRDARFELPELNVRRAGEEADLSWVRQRLIIEVDGGPFHMDRGEDARKQRIWEEAGWTVRRISSGDVYDAPECLIALAAAANVPLARE